MTTDFERHLRERAMKYAGPEQFTESLTFDERDRCRRELGVPSSFWDRVRAVELPMACRVRWVKGPHFNATPDRNLAVGIVWSDGTEVAHTTNTAPFPSPPYLCCEDHRREVRGDWHFIPFTPGKKILIEHAFRCAVHVSILKRVIACGGIASFDWLCQSRPINPRQADDPRDHTWRVRDLCDAGWLIGKVVPLGLGDATIEGDVELSPAFREIFYEAWMDPYWTVTIPWVDPEFQTEWHPTERTGPFATLRRGNFATEMGAIRWASKNLGGTPYSTKLSTILDDDHVRPTNGSNATTE